MSLLPVKHQGTPRSGPSISGAKKRSPSPGHSDNRIVPVPASQQPSLTAFVKRQDGGAKKGRANKIATNCPISERPASGAGLRSFTGYACRISRTQWRSVGARSRRDIYLAVAGAVGNFCGTVLPWVRRWGGRGRPRGGVGAPKDGGRGGRRADKEGRCGAQKWKERRGREKGVEARPREKKRGRERKTEWEPGCVGAKAPADNARPHLEQSVTLFEQLFLLLWRPASHLSPGRKSSRKVFPFYETLRHSAYRAFDYL
ncbi:hypothetical protein KM043_016430 [Ampulex compressa]|nr:hypothetical protein KM043_016430 [Ampulex compressa]